MGYEKIVAKQYNDITNMSGLLNNYVNAYRLLIAGAAELYNINLAKKSEVRKALDRVDEVGDLIDNIVEALDKCEEHYLKYCKIKNDYISTTTHKDMILTEINNDLDFQNNNREDEE